MQKYLTAVIWSFVLALAAPVFAFGYSARDPFIGEVYKAGTEPPQLIFIHENGYEANGSSERLTHVYKNPDGTVATVEETRLTDGVLDSYFVDFAASECGCELKRRGGELEFSFTKGEKTKKGIRPYAGTLITGPTLNGYIADNWDALKAGLSVEPYLPAMPFQQTVQFRLQADSKNPYTRSGVTVVKMITVNPFFRLFADSVYFVVDEDSLRIVEIHGKSLLELMENGKKVNPVVDIYYSYENEG